MTTSTLLIVDDDPIYTHLLKKHLRRHHFDEAIVTLSDGQQALDYLYQRGSFATGTQAPFAMVLDLDMPHVTGYEVLQQVRADAAFDRLIVVILTSLDNLQVSQQCQRLGCNLFLNKPIDHDAFNELAERLLQFLRPTTDFQLCVAAPTQRPES